VTEVVITESDEARDGEAVTSNNNGVIGYGPREPQLARTRDASEPTGAPEDGATGDTDSDVLRGFYTAVAAAGGALRAALAGPAAWPVITRRHPSIAEIWRSGRDSRAWDSDALLVRWPARLFWTADALWETGCSVARVWWRTRITWAVTILLVIAWLVWGS
jgi:hypothetical protein